MKINPYIFRGYDLRGIVGEDLNSEIMEHIGRAYGTFLKRRKIKRAVISFDSRATSPQYSEDVIRGLNWTGINVVNIGMDLIGTFYWAQYYLEYRGGVFITASHNSVEYNGCKFASGFSETLVSEDIQELRKMVEEEDYEKGETSGSVRKTEIRGIYFANLLKKLPIRKVFKVVVDPSCSTAGVIAPDLIRRTGCRVVESNCNLDPSFPLGTPDPTEFKVAKRLSEKVLEEKADVGFSYDADGDRIGVVDEKGNVVWNDVLLALFVIDVLSDYPGATIMYNTLCSKLVEETILEYGGKPFMWRTGHSFLKKKNKEVKAAFIGELSGHFFFSADFYNHDDGLYSTLRLLRYIAKSGKSLTKNISSLPRYMSSPEIKLYCADDKKTELIKKINPVLKKDFPEAEIIDDERAGDGVRVDFKDGMFVIRYSQNAPYLAVKLEGKTESRYEFLRKYINKLLGSYEEIDWQSETNINLEALEKQKLK